MKASVQVELQPFSTPNFVRVAGKSAESGNDAETAIALSALDAASLEQLCAEFRSEVFKKAGKSLPQEAVPVCINCGGKLK